MLKDEPEKINKIIELYKQNYSYVKIAKEVNLTHSYIKYFIKKNLEVFNLEPRIKGHIYHSNKDKIISLYNKGFTYNYICKQINCSFGGLRDYIYRQLIKKNIVNPRNTKEKNIGRRPKNIDNDLLRDKND